MLIGLLGGGLVKAYRLYWLDGAGKIATAEWLEADTDDAAVRDVGSRAQPRACEIWEGRRLVGRVNPAP